MMEYFKNFDEEERIIAMKLADMVVNKEEFTKMELSEAIYSIVIFGAYEDFNQSYIDKLIVNNIKIRIAMEKITEAKKLIREALDITD